jgi:hypothetical protein
MNIDTEAYRLVSLLEVKTISPGETKSEADAVVYSIPDGGNLGEVDSFHAETTDSWGTINSMSFNEKGLSIGFGVEKYKLIKAIAHGFLEEDSRATFADHVFIEKEIFEWVIAIYKSNRSTLTLTAYLEKRIDEELRDYTYYFKLSPIGITDTFCFGSLKIFAFTEEYLRIDYDSRKPENKPVWEKHKESFNHILDSVVAEITVKAVRSKAEVIAKTESVLTVNALKCFLYPESLASHYQLPELDFKSTEVIFSKFITKDNTDGRMKITMQRLNGAMPVVFNTAYMQTLKKSGLETVHDFLLNRKTDELHLLILRAIDQLGITVSTRNLYERIVQLISYFELFLNDENSSRSKAQTYLKNQVLPVLVNLKDLEAFKIKIRKTYDIRDKYLHNRVLNAIDIEDLYHVHKIAFAFLKLLIKLNKELTTKQQLFAHFGIPQ